jgi:hypothetical protein
MARVTVTHVKRTTRIGGRSRQTPLALLLTGGALLAGGLRAHGLAAAPQPGTVVKPSHEQGLGPVPWVELAYSAHKFFLGASTTIRAERASVTALASAVKQPLAGTPISLPKTDIVTIATKTDLPFGRDETVTMWIDPANGAALGGEKITLGHSAYHKFLRYTEEGLYTWRSSPANDRENALGFESWSDRRRYLVAPAVRPAQGTPVTDSYALLYLVTAARLDRPSGGLHLVMLADDRFVEMTFVSGGLTYSRVSFEETWPGGSRSRQGDVLVRTVRATGRLLGAAESSEDIELGFLGMRGALTLHLEAGTGLPVALSGRVPHIGELTVRLQRAVLAAPPSPDAGAGS